MWELVKKGFFFFSVYLNTWRATESGEGCWWGRRRVRFRDLLASLSVKKKQRRRKMVLVNWGGSIVNGGFGVSEEECWLRNVVKKRSRDERERELWRMKKKKRKKKMLSLSSFSLCFSSLFSWGFVSSGEGGDWLDYGGLWLAKQGRVNIGPWGPVRIFEYMISKSHIGFVS